MTLHETEALGDGSWKGEVVPEGTIKGCSVTPVDGGRDDDVTTNTEWIITIDGVEADLAKFSDAIYKQIMSKAKQDRFQGFRPGTVPPHLLPTYKAFCMDEVARETVLEAMQQNNIRPFTDARSQFVIEQVSIPPPQSKKKKGKKKKKTKKGMDDDEIATAEVIDEPEPEPQWRLFDNMDEAIKAGWKPGQSFSFVAKNVKGQNVLPEKDVDGAQAIGR
ncbi:MAG: hypothetical protein SGARI_004645, partial [Bacillariaceae sp.]